MAIFHSFLWLSFCGGSDDKSVCLQCRRPKFDPWVGKIPWRRKWQPTPVFLPRESHGQRSLAGYSPRGRKESDTTEVTEHAHTQLRIMICCSISDQGQEILPPSLYSFFLFSCFLFFFFSIILMTFRHDLFKSLPRLDPNLFLALRPSQIDWNMLKSKHEPEIKMIQRSLVLCKSKLLHFSLKRKKCSKQGKQTHTINSIA